MLDRIDYEALVIAGPDTMVNADTTKLWIDGVNIGSCNTDSLTGGEIEIYNLTLDTTSIHSRCSRVHSSSCNLWLQHWPTHVGARQ